MTLDEKLNLLISKLEEKFGKQKVEILFKHTDDLENNLRMKFLQQVFDGNIDIDDNLYVPISDEAFEEIRNKLSSSSSIERKEYILTLIDSDKIDVSEERIKNLLRLYKEELKELRNENHA